MSSELCLGPQGKLRSCDSIRRQKRMREARKRVMLVASTDFISLMVRSLNLGMFPFTFHRSEYSEKLSALPKVIQLSSGRATSA